MRHTSLNLCLIKTNHNHSYHHPAIIPEDIFNRLQDSLKVNRDNNYRRSKNSLLSKRLFCPYCGNYYGPTTWQTGSGSQITIWRCNSKYKKDSKRRCISPSLKEGFIKQNFIEEINKLIDNPSTIINLLLMIIQSVVEQSKKVNNYLNKFKHKKLIIESFDNDVWYTLQDYLIIHSKNEIVVVLNK